MSSDFLYANEKRIGNEKLAEALNRLFAERVSVPLAVCARWIPPSFRMCELKYGCSQERW